MPFVILPTNSASGGYDITNSARFNSGSSDNLSKTFGTATSRRIFTISTWIKRSNLDTVQNLFTAGTGSGDAGIRFNSGNELFFYEISSPYSAYNFEFSTSQLFRDVSAWYHIVVAVDTTQATNTNRVKIYVNGSQITAFGVASYPSQNYDSYLNNSVTHRISGAVDTTFGTRYYNGYVSETYFIDGQQLTPTSFGETDEDTGIWKPKAYTGTYGTNGFYLQFKNSASLGTDSSGNGNTFTVNNLTSVDQSTDTPTNNFATTNPLDQNGGMTFTDGNLSTASTSASWRSTRATFGITQGKWYWEVKAVNTGGSLLDMMVGVSDISIAIPAEFSSSNPALTYTAGSGNKQLNGVNTSYGATYNVGDIIGVAFDADALTVIFYKNGTSQGTITTGWSSGLTWSPAISLYGRYGNTQASWNFGNPPYTGGSYTDGAGFGNFSYSVPSGYYALNTKNLATFG